MREVNRTSVCVIEKECNCERERVGCAFVSNQNGSVHLFVGEEIMNTFSWVSKLIMQSVQENLK